MTQLKINIPVGIKILLISINTLMAAHLLSSADINVISDPKPTHTEKKYIKLIKVKEITEEIDEKNFFAIPRSLAADDKGNLFVFDSKLVKIFKFDKHFKLVKTFLNEGAGPGETYGFYECPWKLYYSKNGKLYFNSTSQRKLIEFDTDGKYIRDIKIPFYLGGNFHPVVDENQYYYSLSSRGAVDVYDHELKKQCTLLEPKDYKEFLIYSPGDKIVNSLTSPSESNTFYDTLRNNGFIIYLVNSSTVYIFKNHRLSKKFHLRPAKALQLYKDFVGDMEKKAGKGGDWTIPFAWNFFVDKDNEKYFYIDCRAAWDKSTLYKFNLNGELISVLYKKGRTQFMAKRNGLFYGIDSGTIHIYKEE